MIHNKLNQEMFDKASKEKNVYDLIQYALLFYPEYTSAPEKPKKPKDELNSDEWRIYAQQIDKYNSEYAKWKTGREASREYTQQIDSMIKEFIKKESGLADLPINQQDKIWSYAWDKYHSDGFYWIYNGLVEILYLFKD